MKHLKQLLLYFVTGVVLAAQMATAQAPNCRPTQVLFGSVQAIGDTMRIEYGPQGAVRAGNINQGEMTMERDATGRVLAVQLTHPKAGTSVRCPLQYDAQGRCTLYIQPTVSRAMRGTTQADAVTTHTLVYTPIRLVYGPDGRLEYEYKYRDVLAADIATIAPSALVLNVLVHYTWNCPNLNTKTTYRWVPMNEGNKPTVPELVTERPRAPSADRPDEAPATEYLRQTDRTTYHSYSSFPNPQALALRGLPQALPQSSQLPLRETREGVGEAKVFEATITPSATNPWLPGRMEVRNTAAPNGFTPVQEFVWECN